LTGWDLEAIVGLQRENWGAWVAGVQAPKMLGANIEAAGASKVEPHQHNTLISFAYAAALAAAGRDRLSLLDWGGGLGHYAPLSRALLSDVTIDYTCHDLPRFCRAGRDLLPSDRFIEDPALALEGRYDLVLASSSLWYEPDWRARLAQLCGASSAWLFVTRQLILEKGESFVVRQRPAVHGYPTEYLCWVLERDELVSAAQSQGFQLCREFFIHPGPPIKGVSAPIDYRGFLFRRA
jgi:putative methyltransferase (TIGR04325 family)